MRIVAHAGAVRTRVPRNTAGDVDASGGAVALWAKCPEQVICFTTG